MESLPGEVSTGSETLTNQQSEHRKLFSDEQTNDFTKSFLFFNKGFGGIGWSITVIYVLYTSFANPAHFSPTCPSSQFPPGKQTHMYEQNFLFDLHAFVSENETKFDRERELVWSRRILTYGDLQSAITHNTNVSISRVGPLHWRFSFIIFFENLLRN